MLEFKFRVPRPARLAKEVIAFANTQGGRVLIGVGDDGHLAGLRDAYEEEYALREALATHCDPAVAFATERVEISRTREVLVVSVPPSKHRPHFLVNGDDEDVAAAYVRVGASSVVASKEAVRLMRQRPEDATGVRFEFGEKEGLLMRYLDAYGRITVAGFAALAGIPPRQASHTLVLLARAGVVALHHDEREDFFTAAHHAAPVVGARS